jgi:hypothetical protein
MARRKLTNGQIICITILWGFLCYMLLAYSKEIDLGVIFPIIASGIIVFVTIYKNTRGRDK